MRIPTPPALVEEFSLIKTYTESKILTSGISFNFVSVIQMIRRFNGSSLKNIDITYQNFSEKRQC